jgi:hypothetical protein
MSLEIKEEAVKKALQDLFNDTSVTQTETAEALQTIIFEIQEMISTLDEA